MLRIVERGADGDLMILAQPGWRVCERGDRHGFHFNAGRNDDERALSITTSWPTASFDSIRFCGASLFFRPGAGSPTRFRVEADEAGPRDAISHLCAVSLCVCAVRKREATEEEEVSEGTGWASLLAPSWGA